MKKKSLKTHKSLENDNRSPFSFFLFHKERKKVTFWKMLITTWAQKYLSFSIWGLNYRPQWPTAVNKRMKSNDVDVVVVVVGEYHNLSDRMPFFSYFQLTNCDKGSFYRCPFKLYVIHGACVCEYGYECYMFCVCACVRCASFEMLHVFGICKAKRCGARFSPHFTLAIQTVIICSAKSLLLLNLHRYRNLAARQTSVVEWLEPISKLKRQSYWNWHRK